MSVACAAMRRVAAGEHTEQYDQDAAEEFRSRVSALLRPGSRGVRKAREVLAMVDGRVESPGEAVSLLYLRELGYDITVQIAVPSAHGTYVIDFDLGDAWGEFDGQVKYTDPALRGERTAADVVLAEKEREGWIRGTTGRRIIRWGWAHLESVDALACRLRAFGVRS